MKPINIITGNKTKQKEPDRLKRILPAGSKFPTIRGQWQPLSNGRVLAWYTADQFAQCRKMFKLIKDVEPLRR